MRKVATHALNALQETREEFVRKYLHKYHQKMNEQIESRQRKQNDKIRLQAQQEQLIQDRKGHVKDDFKGVDSLEREPNADEQRVLQRKESI